MFWKSGKFLNSVIAFVIDRLRWGATCALILTLQFVLSPTTSIKAAEEETASALSRGASSKISDEELDLILQFVLPSGNGTSAEEAAEPDSSEQANAPQAADTSRNADISDEEPAEAVEEAAPEPTPDSLNREGAELVKSGSMEEAISKFKEALEMDQSHVGARFNLAFTYQQIDKLDEAESEYRRALEKQELTRAHLMLGLLYEKKSEYILALNEFETVIDKDPENKIALDRIEKLKSKIAIEETIEQAGQEPVVEPSETIEEKAINSPEEAINKEDTPEKIVQPELHSLAKLFGMPEIPVLADREGQFVNSMAQNQTLEGESAAQVDETDLLESIKTGRSFNRDSRAAIARKEQAEAKTGQAFSYLLPSLSIRANRGIETSEPSAARDENRQPLDSSTHTRTDAALTITQTLFNLPKYMEWRRSKAKENATGENFRASDGDAYVSTVSTYLTLVSSRLQAYLMRDFEAQLAELLSYIEKRAEAGATSVSDMSRVRARSQATLSARLEQESAHLAAGTEFVRLTNLVPQKVMLPSPADVGASFLPESFDSAVKIAMESNPEIASLKAELEAARINQLESKGRYLPRITAELSDTYSDQAQGSPYDQRDRRAMLVLNWELFSGGKDYQYNLENIAKHKELRYRLDDERRRVVQELAANYSELSTTKERIISGYEELESISVAVEAMTKRMLSGNQSLLDLLDVYDRYSQVRSRLVNLHVREMNTVSSLIRLTRGTPWPPPEEMNPATEIKPTLPLSTTTGEW